MKVVQFTIAVATKETISSQTKKLSGWSDESCGLPLEIVPPTYQNGYKLPLPRVKNGSFPPQAWWTQYWEDSRNTCRSFNKYLVPGRGDIFSG